MFYRWLELLWLVLCWFMCGNFWLLFCVWKCYVDSCLFWLRWCCIGCCFCLDIEIVVGLVDFEFCVVWWWCGGCVVWYFIFCCFCFWSGIVYCCCWCGYDGCVMWLGCVICCCGYRCYCWFGLLLFLVDVWWLLVFCWFLDCVVICWYWCGCGFWVGWWWSLVYV